MMDFAALLEQYFSEAVQEKGSCTERTEIAGQQIEFCFAGERWAELPRALVGARGEKKAGSGKPDLRVMVWDGEQPARNHFLRAYLFTVTNWWFDYVGPRGQLLDVSGPELDALYVPGPDLLYALDQKSNTGFCWKRDATPLPYWEVCSPFRPVLHCWLRSRGFQFVHAAAVGTAEGGALLAGKGGSGKSTTALACLHSSLQYLSDDYCVLGKANGGYSAFGLYTTVKLVGAEDLERFPLLASQVWNPDREPDQKAAFFLQERYPESFIESFPLKAIVLPVVTGQRDTRFQPCSGSRALSALAPSTLSQLPASGAADLRFLSELPRKIPAYEMRLGTDMAQIPLVLQELIQAAG